MLMPPPAEIMNELADEFLEWKTPPGVQLSVLEFVSRYANERTDWPLVKDLLCDASMLAEAKASSKSIEPDVSDAFRRYVIQDRKFRGNSQATRIDLRSGLDSVGMPVQEKNALYLETQTDTFFIMPPNSLQMMAWLRLFRRAVDDMKSGSSRSLKLTGNLTVHQPSGMRLCRCSITTGAGRPLELECEEIDSKVSFKLNLSTLKAITVAFDFRVTPQYEFVVEIVCGKLNSVEEKLDPTEPHRQFSSLALEASDDAPIADADVIIPQNSRSSIASFYTVGSDSQNMDDAAAAAGTGGEEAGHLSPSKSHDFGSYIEGDEAAKKPSGWRPGMILNMGVNAGIDGAGFVVGKVVKTTKTIAKVTKHAALQTVAGTTHVVTGAVDVAVDVATGVGNTGVKVVKNTAKGVVATAETGVNLATGKAEASEVLKSVAQGAKDAVVNVGATVGQTGKNLAHGKIIDDVKTWIGFTSTTSREIFTTPLRGTKPLWNESCVVPLTPREIEEAMSSHHQGISLFLFQGHGEEERHRSAAFLPYSKLLTPSNSSLLFESPTADRNNDVSSSAAQAMFPKSRLGESELTEHIVEMSGTAITFEITIISASNLSEPPAEPTDGHGKVFSGLLGSSNKGSRSPRVNILFVMIEKYIYF
jgi:hypothetical protein